MISEFIGRLKNWIRAKILAAQEAVMPEVPVVSGGTTVLVASEGNVLDMGKRYRLTSGHSPIFSLFTFFGLRQ